MTARPMTARDRIGRKPETGVPRPPREGSTMWAVIQVLSGKRKPMTAGEIYAEIRDRKLAPGLKGKTPEQTVAAQLAVHTKRGLYVERSGRGKFRLKRSTRSNQQ
jgi:hypothetical protein